MDEMVSSGVKPPRSIIGQRSMGVYEDEGDCIIFSSISNKLNYLH